MSLLHAAQNLRAAQRAYMEDRGNEEKGKAVAAAAGLLDIAISNTINGTSFREEVYVAIDGERDYQDKRWNSSTTESGGRHSNVEFLVYIRDYVEEALHFASRNPDPAAVDFTRHSLRKIAALGVAALEQNGVLPRG